ncbi:MAG: glucose 1-dehydrogenase [Caldilineaceae bacterium]|nr:glucose 1-dehydrogenase [Caldilineaceae bacterium]
MQLQGKTAIITGGASGFGAGIAQRFAAEGAQVIVADINGPGAEAQAAAIQAGGGLAHPVQVDVSNNDSMAALVEQTLGICGRIDICVNNAGTTHKNGPLLSVDEATFDRVYAVNVKSIYLSAMHIVPVFRQQGGGVFLNIASTAGLRPRPGLVWYAGTKGAVITLTKALAVDLAGEKIRVNAINPVAGDTPLLAQFLPGEDTPEIRQKFIDTIPLGRLSRPDDIAKAALFLVSDESSFITGVCMEVDGGRCI